MKKIDMYDVSNELATYSIQLKDISELILFNLNKSDISKSDELDRLYFLNDYIKQLSNELDQFSTKVIRGDKNDRDN
ncbi:hypothetical protein [Ligilactobacillus salivarius]|uniref:Uncharacterized protein n=2 Tax=Ligilactobacillus salivarius TaxID=1624 RepID=C2EI00_9LACO|nr:hypothetical protein [Ligilactobacillus salivarius]ATP37566.1 hypothetical protein CR531_05175 [Ligilactobacillus salivarius]EEJ73853.1 hypothetical protein HMPREF0545_1272 [Ligilactobacillus salivarius DSM 20555 = ATCC 11741]MBE7937916.1 hypothetical protein [Ligilactobacillus salivarius]MDE1507321.1 hypothetical protein [Ligilactobacillus salivarius]MDE1522286.1 hypothetical protein [Ligilactobacillus salivarius]